ncbi:MAG: geranylgeranylglyceryl/heptaprenylglyceryl phosphate synthase [Bacteroidia bacterium]|nr:geranylgeranylglyceryl/heptaprenylglyceryl phosphate synthase [Bacteroidia bacterium]
MKSFALLIDPDKFEEADCQKLTEVAAFDKADWVFVGGSLINGSSIHLTIQRIKQHSTLPVIIFPGSNMHMDSSADGILFLSLISGRNPEFLIGQHIVAAPFLKRSRLEVLPTGYMLIEGGKATTVSYISNTTPIPHDKPEVAACTAMAGEMLGLKLIYADAGSGAEKPISSKMVSLLRKSIDVPLIVGGGIRSGEKAAEILLAGADIVVVGNGVEANPHLIDEIYNQIGRINQSAT